MTNSLLQAIRALEDKAQDHMDFVGRTMSDVHSELDRLEQLADTMSEDVRAEVRALCQEIRERTLSVTREQTPQTSPVPAEAQSVEEKGAQAPATPAAPAPVLPLGATPGHGNEAEPVAGAHQDPLPEPAPEPWKQPVAETHHEDAPQGPPDNADQHVSSAPHD